MTGKMLVTYVSNAGSTAEVAAKIAEQLQQTGAEVEVKPLAGVSDLSGYGAVVVGGPMIIGWHRDATRFLKTHQPQLSQVPTAYFITSLELTPTGAAEVNGVPVYVDPKHGHAPAGDKLNFKQKQTTETAFLKPILNAAPAIKPVSIALFGGALDYGKLKLWQKLFVRFLIRAQAGDYRNWDAIQAWATQLGAQLSGGN